MSAGGMAPADVLRILSRSSEFLPHFALVAGGPSSAAPLAALELGADRKSWFPVVAGPEQAEGRYVAKVTAHIGLDPTLAPAHNRQNARLVPAFRGWSTMVLTAGRMVGICPRGEAVSGPVDFERGTAVVWTFPFRHVDAARVVDAGSGSVVAVRSTDRLVGGMTLTSVHRVVAGSLQPVALEELATMLNTASRRRPDAARPAAGAPDAGPPSAGPPPGAPEPSPWS